MIDEDSLGQIVNVTIPNVRPCPLCGGINDDDDFLIGTNYIQCARCDLIYIFFDITDNISKHIDNSILYSTMLDNYYLSKSARLESFLWLRDYASDWNFNSRIKILGSGGGFIYDVILNITNSCSINGLEINAKKLDISRQIFDYKQLTYLADVSNLIIEHNDVVIVNNVLSWIDNPYQFINNILNNKQIIILFKIEDSKDVTSFYRILWTKTSILMLESIISHSRKIIYDNIDKYIIMRII